MDKIVFKLSNNKTIEVDDSLNSHGGIGVDFWSESNGGGTLMFALEFEDAVKLTKWLIEYLAKTNNN